MKFFSFGSGADRIAFKVGEDNVKAIAKNGKLVTVTMGVTGDPVLDGKDLVWVLDTSKFNGYSFVK